LRPEPKETQATTCVQNALTVFQLNFYRVSLQTRVCNATKFRIYWV